MDKAISETRLPDIKPFNIGKVRDIYGLDDRLLIVATDRISAFDVILPTAIPYKGKILTAISEFWFNFTESIIPNHVVSMNVNEFPQECQQYKNVLEGRSMLVKKAEVVPIESLVRGYISG